MTFGDLADAQLHQALARARRPSETTTRVFAVETELATRN